MSWCCYHRDSVLRISVSAVSPFSPPDLGGRPPRRPRWCVNVVRRRSEPILRLLLSTRFLRLAPSIFVSAYPEFIKGPGFPKTSEREAFTFCVDAPRPPVREGNARLFGHLLRRTSPFFSVLGSFFLPSRELRNLAASILPRACFLSISFSPSGDECLLRALLAAPPRNRRDYEGLHPELRSINTFATPSCLFLDLVPLRRSDQPPEIQHYGRIKFSFRCPLPMAPGR